MSQFVDNKTNSPRVVNHPQTHATTRGPAVQGRTLNQYKSFASELNQMRQAHANHREGFKPELASAGQEDAKTINQEIFTQSLVQANPAHKARISMDTSSLISQAELKLKELNDKDKLEEIHKSKREEDSLEDSEKLSEKFHKSESTIAASGQSHFKQVTEAVREGNVAPQEYQQDSSQERRKQLANWEDLAPRITEDPTNKAVRLDIPGINDIETLIVRMKPGGIGIQVVGAKDTMSRLANTESELAAKLKAHNISLDGLQVFDGELLRKAKTGKTPVAA